MREVMNQLQIPEGMGAIVRTAGVGRTVEELQWDLDNLRTQWEQIAAAAQERAAPFLVYRESDAVTRAMRDTCPMTLARSSSMTRPPSRKRRNTCSASCPRTSSGA